MNLPPPSIPRIQAKEEKFSAALSESRREAEVAKSEAEALRHEQVMGGERGLETAKLKARVQARRADGLERKVRVLEKAGKGGTAPAGLVRELEAVTKREQVGGGGGGGRHHNPTGLLNFFKRDKFSFKNVT